MHSTPIVEARGVEKYFGHVKVLHGIDLKVEPGEVVCIIGRSGSGKSTFLRCVNNLEEISAGELLVNGEYVGYERHRGHLRQLKERDVVIRRSRIGMVFQHFNLFSNMSVLENLTVGPISGKREPKGEATERAYDLLKRVGLGDRANAFPSELSGGQQQRVAIARALAMRPELMLFDEPTSSLDPELVGEVLSVIKDIALDATSMLVVTHEMGFAREVADRVCFMSNGRIIESGPPDQLLQDPQETETRAFLRAVL